MQLLGREKLSPYGKFLEISNYYLARYINNSLVIITYNYINFYVFTFHPCVYTGSNLVENKKAPQLNSFERRCGI